VLIKKRPKSRACALETTANFLALTVPCIPGPEGSARLRGPGYENAYGCEWKVALLCHPK
jgi:hypothetical protein